MYTTISCITLSACSTTQSRRLILGCDIWSLQCPQSLRSYTPPQSYISARWAHIDHTSFNIQGAVTACFTRLYLSNRQYPTNVSLTPYFPSQKEGNIQKFRVKFYFGYHSRLPTTSHHNNNSALKRRDTGSSRDERSRHSCSCLRKRALGFPVHPPARGTARVGPVCFVGIGDARLSRT